MDHSKGSELAEEYMLAALDAGCGALRSLEAAASLAADHGEPERLQAGLHRALDLLREALTELRSSASASPVAAGFVLPAPATGASTGRAAPARAEQSLLGRRSAAE